MMIIVTATMNLKPNKKEEFILKAQDLISATRLEEGCISYGLYVSTENKDELVMLERWEDNNSLNKHMETDHFKQFGNTIKQLLTGKIDVKSYSVE